MAINSQHVTGFLVGLGASALGLYMYRRNQAKVDAFLRQRGIEVGGGGGNEPASMTLEELVAEKERLEDLIAEREMAAPEPAPSE